MAHDLNLTSYASMAANFWSSSHYKQWILTKDVLEKGAHKRDKEELKFTEEDIRRIKVVYVTEIQNLGRRLALRQRVIASAIVYFRRFYSKNNFVEFCPRLIGATCLYISTKSEECSTQSPAYRIANEMKKLGWQYTTNNILECEFYVLETLQFFLIVYHPYRSLTDYLTDCKLEKGSLEIAWNLVNDSYCTDMCLLYPPYVIALAAINIASCTCDVDLRLWFSEISVDMKDIWMASNDLLDFYDLVKREKGTTMTPTSSLVSRLPTFPRYHTTAPPSSTPSPSSTSNNNNNNASTNPYAKSIGRVGYG